MDLAPQDRGPLTIGTEPLVETLPDDRPAAWTVDLEEGEYIEVVALQRGLDVHLKLFGPDGEELRHSDRPTYASGRETLRFVAPQAGRYELRGGLEGRAEDRGTFAVEIVARRPATEADRELASADREFDRLIWQPTSEDVLTGLAELLALRRRIGTPWDIAEAQLELGRRTYDLPHLEAALSFFESEGAWAYVVTAAGFLGRHHTRLEQYGAAWDTLTRATEAFDRLGAWIDPDSGTGPFNDLGNVELALGRLESAALAYEKALELETRSRPRAPRHRAVALIGLGTVWRYRQQLWGADWFFEGARRAAREADDHRLLRSLEAERCEVSRLRGELTDARRCFRDLLVAEGLTARERLRILTRRLQLEVVADQPEEVDALFEQALALSGATGTHRALLLHLQGVDALRRGRLDDAISFQRDARSLYKDLGDPQGQVSTLFAEGQVLRRKGALFEAYELFRQARSRAEELRAAPRGFASRTAYLAARRHYWEAEVETALALDREFPGDGWRGVAFEAAEQAKARTLEDSLGEARTMRSDASADWLETERRLLDELSREEDLDDRIELSIRLARHRRDRRAAAPAADETRDALTLDGFENNYMNGGSTLLSYFLGSETAYVFVLPHGGTPSVAELGPTRDVERAAAAWLDGLASLHDAADPGRRAAAERLSRLILEPIRSTLEQQNRPWLVVLPDGLLNTVPFGALPWVGSGTKHSPLRVSDGYEVTIGPSLATLAALRDRAQGREEAVKGREDALEQTVTLFANPDYPPPERGGPVPLPGSAREVEAVRRLVEATEGKQGAKLTARCLLGEAASLTAARDAVTREARILHFAVHGDLRTDHPDSSALLLSSGTGEPGIGRLTAGEIAGLGLRAELVVLSACHSGAGAPVRGEGLQSLARAFLLGGSQRVLQALWEVDDDSAEIFMTTFYESFLRYPRSATRALREAQQALRDHPHYSHPYYWAGYVLQGEWWLEPHAPRLEDDGPDIGKVASPDPEPPENAGPPDLPGMPPAFAGDAP